MPKAKHPVVIEQETGEKFKKTNEAIGLRVSKGHLSFISRKLFNVLVLHAQKLGAPGLNAPIESETAANYFWVPASEIQRDASYNSNDTKMLMEATAELQDIKITSETDKEWTSEHLVSSVKIVNPAGLKKRGGRLWVGFAFAPEVLSLVMNPRTFTTLSLYYMTVLRTNAGLALYEAAKKHAWKEPVGMTERMPWEKWRDYLEGMAGEDMPDWKHQFKFFKDRVLKKAVIEVNTLTDIDVQAIEHKDGKRVIDLQFRVKKKSQGTLDLPAPPVINSELIERLKSLGLSKHEAESIFSTQPEKEIRDALDYTAKRAGDSKLPELLVPAAFFKEALRRNYAGTGKRIADGTKKPTKKAEQQEIEPATEQPDPASGRAMAAFEALPPADRARTLERFAATLRGPVKKTYDTQGLGSPMIRGSLAGWLARGG
jgi:hypothetical protein